MADSDFLLLEHAFAAGGPDALFEVLIDHAREQGRHRLLFGAKSMQARLQLGLPPLETGADVELDPGRRTIYETALRDAAREAGELCLAQGDIPSAWTYYQALGETEPVAAAIEKVTESEDLDRVIEIAFREGVNRRKGFELILERHGLCSAITWYPSNSDRDSRQHCLRLLVQTIYRIIADALAATVANAEGSTPPDKRIANLIEGRDWLFEGASTYTDSTHLASILRYSPELNDPETVRMAVELADYGSRLAPMFHFRGDPPFEDIYRDHAIYLRALLGEDVDCAIAHFRGKASNGPDTGAVEVLIDLLVRVGRIDDAIRASEEYAPKDAGGSNCPSLVQLCQMAGDYDRMRSAAEQRGDLLAFAAAVIGGGRC